MAGNSSASTKMVKQQEKRKQPATPTMDEKAKKPRPSQLINFTAQPRPRGSGTAAPVVVPPLHGGASNMATTALPFPMTGVSGAAPLWSTAVTLDAASRAAALTSSSLPATTSANGPAAAPVAIAPATGLQPAAAGVTASAAGAALALPAARAAIGVSPPLVFAHAGAEGQLVPLPLQFVGYHPTCRASAVGLSATAVGIPLALALDKIENGALGRMLSALMPLCNPPLRQHQSKSGPPPPWWPTGSENWWATELLAHLDTVEALKHTPVPVPFASSYSLKKAQKVAVLIAIVKHLAPDFASVAAAVRHSGKLSVSETGLWHSALNNEHAKCMRPLFIVLQQQQGGVGGGIASTDPSAGGSVVVHSGNAASDGCELHVANLPAGAPVSVPAKADGSRSEVIAAAELVVEKEQRSDGDGGVGVGIVSATDASTDPSAAGSVVVVHSDNVASDGCELLIANIPAGAPVSVSAPADGSRGEVIAEAEMVVEKEQCSDGDGGVGIGVVSATDASTDPSGAGSVVVHCGNAASVGCDLQIANANLPAGASVSAPADGSCGKVIAAAELVVEKEQRSDSDGGSGVVCATDAPGGDDGRDQPANFPAGGDGSTHKQGAVVAAAPTTGHVRQVAGGPEMTMQQLEQGGGVPGDEVAAAAAEDGQALPVVDPNAVAAIEEEAPKDRHWWYDSDELNRLFAEFESFGDSIWN